MILVDYLTQDNPIRMPKVYLEKEEYKVHLSIKVGQDILTAIEIPVLWKKYGINPCYVKKNNEENLYTQDEDGNPKNRSCFYIKQKNL
jgi:hypothetical protein